MNSKICVHICDYESQEVVQDCSLKPSETTEREAFWLWAKNNKYDSTSVNNSKIGKWMIFPSKTQVDKLWEKVKEGVRVGDLWDAKVSTVKPSPGAHVIIIYTKNYEDVQDVRVLDYLEKAKMKDVNRVIYYKTDNQTYAGVYSGGKQRASIYASNTVRKLLQKRE